ncbi:hypothetical protein X760_31775 [Mesorhizobium sp. LSHC422A00]|nr:hypothetical protein X760_31775 [Mesorhizobium sp. LSHC422A00]
MTASTTITIDFIIKDMPRPKTFWAHYGPEEKGTRYGTLLMVG